MASSRDIVAQAFERKQPERIPAGICLGGSWPIFVEGRSLKELLTDAKETAEIFFRVNDRVDADFVTVGTGATAFLIEALGGEIRFSSNGAPEILSCLVEKEEDIDKLDIAKALVAPKLVWLREVAAGVIRLNKGNRSIFVSGRAPFTLAGQLYGLENLSKALYKNRKLVEKLLEFTTKLSVEYYKYMLELEGIDGIFIADPSASGDVVSRRHFEAFVLPYLTRVLEQLMPYRKLSMLHICGNITDRLHLLPLSGIQFVSLDSKVDLSKAKEILQGKIGIAGNVNPVAVLEDKTPEEVYQETIRCLREAAYDGGFLLLPGCDISAKVPEDNVVSMVKAAHQWDVVTDYHLN